MNTRPSRRSAAIRYFIFDQLGTILVIAQGFLVTPLYVRLLPLPLYGGWLAAGNVLTWLALVDPGLGDVLRQRIAFQDGRGDHTALGRSIGTGLAAALTLSFGPMLAWPIAPIVAEAVGVSGSDAIELQQAFRLGLVSTSASLLGFGLNGVITGLQLTGRFGVTYVLSGLVGLAVTVTALLRGGGVNSIPLGMLARAAVIVLGAAGIILHWAARHREVRPRPSRAELRELRGIFSVFYAARIGGTVASYADAFLVARFISPSAAAVYSLTERAYTLVRMPPERLQAVLLPGLAHLAGEGDGERLRTVTRLASRIAAAGLLAGVGGVCALNEAFVGLWVGPALFGGFLLTVLLAVDSVSATMSITWQRSLFASGAIRGISYVAIAEAAAKLTAQIVFLASGLGIVGLPLAGVLARFGVSGPGYAYVAGQRFNTRARIELAAWWRDVSFALGGVAAGAAIFWLDRQLHFAWTWLRFAIAAVLVGTVLVALVLAVEPQLRKAVRSRGRNLTHER